MDPEDLRILEDPVVPDALRVSLEQRVLALQVVPGDLVRQATR